MKFPILLLCLVIVGCSQTDTSLSLLPVDGKTTLTGVVIDMNGTPVEDTLLFIQYRQVDGRRESSLDTYLQTKTDKTGGFSFTNADPGLIQFRLNHQDIRTYYNKYALISVKIGDVTYYAEDRWDPLWPSPSGSFSIPPDTLLEDIEVRVKRRMRIGGKVMFKNGTPLAYYPLRVDIQWEGKPKRGSSGMNTEVHLDIHGYFTLYGSNPGYYKLTVTYKGLTAESEKFLLNDGEHREDLVFTFDSQPIPISITPLESERFP